MTVGNVNIHIPSDLKPDNILFKTRDPASEIKIVDFGVSCVDDAINPLRSRVGSPYCE